MTTCSAPSGAPPETITRRASLLVGAALLTGCHGPRDRPASPPAPEPDVVVDELGALLTSAGLQWSIEVDAQGLWRDETLRPHLARILRGERLDSLATSTGVDLREVPRTIIARYEGSTAWLVRHDRSPDDLERRFRDRLTTAITRAVHGHQRVLVRGGIGRHERHLALIGRDVACFQIDGPPRGPARIAILYSLGKLTAIPNLAVDPLRAQAREELGASPAMFFWPGPFEGPLADGLRGLLGASVALAVTATPMGAGLLLKGVLLGDFARAGDEALDVLAGAWSDLSGADLGHLLGLDRPLNPPRASVGPRGLTWEVMLESRRLVEGLAAATVDDARTFLQAAPPPPRPTTVDGSAEGAYAPPSPRP